MLFVSQIGVLCGFFAGDVRFVLPRARFSSAAAWFGLKILIFGSLNFFNFGGDGGYRPYNKHNDGPEKGLC